MDDFGMGSMDVPEIQEPIEVPDIPEAPDINEISEPSEPPDVSAEGYDSSLPDRDSGPPWDEGIQDSRGDTEPPGYRRPDGWTDQPSADALPQDFDPGSRSPLEFHLAAGADQSSLDFDHDAKQLETNPEFIHSEDEVRPEGIKPNSIYERNGYEYKTDEMGRTREVTGDLKLEEGERTKLQTEVGHMGVEDDEGGHLVGTRFNGPADAFNLVPQNSNLNRGEWKAMENSWANELAEGKDVKVMIDPVFTGDNVRPDSFEVLTQVNGELTYTSFVNQASNDSTRDK